ncbi:MAG: M15 family metallopeptidase [Acidimicrobiales bacterium]
MHRTGWRSALVAGVVVLTGAACGSDGPSAVTPPVTSTESPGASTSAPAPAPTDTDTDITSPDLTTTGGQATSTAPASEATAAAPLPTRPPWLGQRTLPTDSDGNAPPQTTPAELADRRFATVDLLAPPSDGQFHATVAPLEGDPLRRSTWSEGCPVGVEDLRYLTLGFWGFDGLPHTGEMIVNAEVADDLVEIFRTLFEARYPIEEMRITTQAEVDAPPIGDGNNTGAFVCRAAVGSSKFSEHAYGLAVDINPFINPYIKGRVVLPELAAAYTDRHNLRPGMIVEGDAVVAGFDAAGWGWGGRWSSLKDYQHFSLHDR